MGLICRSMLKPNSGGGESVDYICEYENSLPDGALNRESLNIQIRLYQGPSYEASVSAATDRIIATMDGGVFPALREDAWYDYCAVCAETGRERLIRQATNSLKRRSIKWRFLRIK